MKMKSFAKIVSLLLSVLFVLSSAVVSFSVSAATKDVKFVGEGSSVTLKESPFSDFSDIMETLQPSTEMLTLAQVQSKPSATKIDDSNNAYSAYLYKDSDNNYYYWSDADTIFLPESTTYWFSAFYNVKTIDLSGFDSSNVTGMYYMFENCSSLTSVNLSSFDVSNVTDMEGMFTGCSSLTSLDLSSFHGTYGTAVGYMFCDCSALTSISFGNNINTFKVSDCSALFYNCSSLTSLDLSSFDTSSCISMWHMFYGCSNLSSLNLGDNFDTSLVDSMESMFEDCSALTYLDLGDKFSVAGLGSSRPVTCMFNNCTSLETIYSNSFNYRYAALDGRITYWDEHQEYVPEDDEWLDIDEWYAEDESREAAWKEEYTTNVFGNCPQLVGGNGTTYSSTHDSDLFYARVDGENGQQGYFTSLSERPVPVAPPVTNPEDINTSGDEGTAMVTLTTEAASFNVTVPTILPVAVDSNNNVVTAENAVISNNGNGAVQITNCTLDTTDTDWSIVAFDTDFRTVPVNTKQFGFKLNDVEAIVSGNLFADDQFAVINGESDSDALDYTARIAIQSSSANAVNIGSVIFTVANYTAA